MHLYAHRRDGEARIFDASHLARPRLFNAFVEKSLPKKARYAGGEASLVIRFKPPLKVSPLPTGQGAVEPYNTFRGGYRCNVFELTA